MIGNVVYWLLQVGVLGAVIVAIGLLIRKGGEHIYPSYKTWALNRVNQVVMIGTMAVIIFFGEMIGSVVTWNLFVVYLTVVSVYALVRWWILADNRRDRNETVLVVMCGIIGIGLVIYAMKSLGEAFTNAF